MAFNKNSKQQNYFSINVSAMKIWESVIQHSMFWFTAGAP